MFRSDREALAGKVDELRSDNERLRAENEAMRQDLLARRTEAPTFAPRANLYRGGDTLLTPGEQAALAKHDLQAFPIWATVVTHVLTLGVASFFRLNALHGKLPKGERDDPSTLKATLLHFVPYFNYYWVFVNALRLADRVNLQLRLRGERDVVSRAAIITACVLTVIPYVQFITAPIAWLVVALSIQRAVNRIVEIDTPRREQDERVRFHAVADLPGPDDVVRAAEEEAAAAEEAPRRRSV